MILLGHIISSEGVEVDQRKMEMVKILPRHLTPTDSMIFLGLVGYYRRFVDSFTSIAYPLTTLTQKSKKFGCSKACVKFLNCWKISSLPLQC